MDEMGAVIVGSLVGTGCALFFSNWTYDRYGSGPWAFAAGLVLSVVAAVSVLAAFAAVLNRGY